MLLALDVGNTNIVVGCMEGKTLLRAFRLATRRDSTGGDYAAAISQLLELAGISRQDVEQIIISSVVPQVTRALQGTALLLTGKEPLVLGQNVRCDLPILIDQPETLGADLLAAAVGALDQFRPPLLLIDMGTATTVTVVDCPLCTATRPCCPTFPCPSRTRPSARTPCPVCKAAAFWARPCCWTA